MRRWPPALSFKSSSTCSDWAENNLEDRRIWREAVNAVNHVSWLLRLPALMRGMLCCSCDRQLDFQTQEDNGRLLQTP